MCCPRTRPCRSSPFGAFSWQLWLLLFSTAFLVGGVLWLYDVLAQSTQCSHTNVNKGADPECGSWKSFGSEGQQVSSANDAGVTTSRLTGNLVNGSGRGSGGGDCDAWKAPAKDGASSSNGGDGPQAGTGQGSLADGQPLRLPRRLMAALGVKPAEEKDTLQRLGEPAVLSRPKPVAAPMAVECQLASSDAIGGKPVCRMWHAFATGRSRTGRHPSSLPAADSNLRNSLLYLSRVSIPPVSASLPSQVVLWAW